MVALGVRILANAADPRLSEIRRRTRLRARQDRRPQRERQRPRANSRRGSRTARRHRRQRDLRTLRRRASRPRDRGPPRPGPGPASGACELSSVTVVPAMGPPGSQLHTHPSQGNRSRTVKSLETPGVRLTRSAGPGRDERARCDMTGVLVRRAALVDHPGYVGVPQRVAGGRVLRRGCTCRKPHPARPPIPVRSPWVISSRSRRPVRVSLGPWPGRSPRPC